MNRSIMFALVTCLCSLTVIAQTTDERIATLKVGDATSTYTGANALVDAYNAAPNHGGVITLSSGEFKPININKGIAIYGNGFAGESATIITPTLQIDASSSTTIHLEGLDIKGVYNTSSWPGTNVYSVGELTVVNCKLQSIEFKESFTTNATLRNCVITQHFFHVPYNKKPSFESIAIENSIIHHFHSWITVAGNVTFDHSIILSSTNNTSSRYKLPPYVYTNCILPYTMMDGGTANYCVFNCGEFAGSSLDSCKFEVSSIDLFGVDNLYGQGMGMTHAYVPEQSYRLVSPANYMGNDGTEVGIYGGKYPWGGVTITGDVNGDGSVDLNDMNIIINIMLGKANANDYASADVDGNGAVELLDMNIVINILLGK